MARYEIINPSDPYEVDAPTLKAAAVLCLFLGRGQYAFEPIGHDGPGVPLFMFGGETGMEAWFKEQFGQDVQSVIRETKDDGSLLAAARAVTLKAKVRTSLNDIGGAAKRLVAALKKDSEE